MKNIRTSHAALVAVLLLSAIALPAAAATMSPVKIDLPDDVTVGGTQLGAGAYTITQVNNNSGSPILMFRSGNGTSVDVLATLVEAPNTSVPSHTALVLRRSGTQREVQQIWIEGTSFGFEFMMPTAK